MSRVITKKRIGFSRKPVTNSKDSDATVSHVDRSSPACSAAALVLKAFLVG